MFKKCNKITNKIIIESYDFFGSVGFLFNCFQSIFSELVFGLFNLYLFDVLMEDSTKLIPFLFGLFMIAIYFIFGIPLWGFLMERCVNQVKGNLLKLIVKIYFFSHKNNIAEQHSSSILSLLQEDVAKTAELGGWNFVVLIQAILSGIIAILAFLIVSPEILVTLIILGFIPIIFDVLSAKIIRNQSDIIRDFIEKRLKIIIELINNIVIVKVFGITEKTKDKVIEYSENICKAKKKIYRLELITNSVHGFVFNALYRVVILILGLYLYNLGRLSFGSIMFMLSMSEGISFCMSSIGTYVKQLQEILVSKRKIDKFYIDMGGEFYPKFGFELTDNIESIKFKHIYFKYPNSENIIFEDMNLELFTKHDYIIVGENGCGKSSIIKLFFGLYFPTCGEILVNDLPIYYNDCNNISYVPQEISIYRDSLYNNLVLNKKDISKKDIELALQTVELLDWAKNLPAFMDTIINEKGKNLSKGQKSRIAIARALLKFPQFIFMDEIDSNIDSTMLSSIMKKIKKNYPDCSVVVITHRSSETIYDTFKRIYITNHRCILK